VDQFVETTKEQGQNGKISIFISFFTNIIKSYLLILILYKL